MLADRFHPIRTSMAALVLYTLGTLWGGFYARDQTTFMIAFILNGVISGVYFTTSISIAQRFLPRAEFAQMSSASGIIIALCGMILGPAVGFFMDHMNHNYRYTYFISAGLAMITLALLAIVHHKFMKQGGPDNYQAPEPTGKAGRVEIR
jgi:MFS family permease